MCFIIAIERHYSLIDENDYVVNTNDPCILGAVTLCLRCYSESARFDQSQDEKLCSARISNLDDKCNDIISKTTSLDMHAEAVRKSAL